MAGEDLMASPAEVLREECVEDGVHAGVSVRQTVGDDAEDKRGVVQGEPAKLHPHSDDVMRHPADGEGSDQQENNLGGLQGNRGDKREPITTSSLVRTPPTNTNRARTPSTAASGRPAATQTHHKHA